MKTRRFFRTTRFRKKESDFLSSGRRWNRCTTRRRSKKGRLRLRRRSKLLRGETRKSRPPTWRAGFRRSARAERWRGGILRCSIASTIIAMSWSRNLPSAGIPFAIEGLDVLETPEVRDVVACLAAAVSPNDACQPVSRGGAAAVRHRPNGICGAAILCRTTTRAAGNLLKNSVNARSKPRENW